jgi:tRNA/tmRNA/rRNA uracil-C5-methylase (TrmA/RlmC/RlmD family)
MNAKKTPEVRATDHKSDTSTDFGSVLAKALKGPTVRRRTLAPGQCMSARGRICLACNASRIDYPAEVEVKQRALSEFWSATVGHGTLHPLEPSPLGREYRTVSKRKVFIDRHGPRLVLLSPDKTGIVSPITVDTCSIEPDRHNRIFKTIQGFLHAPPAVDLALRLQYVILRGDYAEHSLIFNVRDIDGKVTAGANVISKWITKKFPEIVGVSLFQGDEDQGYYLGSKKPGRAPVVKKVFGKDKVHQRIDGKHFLFSPVSFSQVNLSIIDRVIGRVRDVLGLSPEMTLCDLYSGYGLFAICLASQVSRVIASESSAASVQSAIENAERNRTGNVRFLRNVITEESIGGILRQARPCDAVLLDPPRNGTEPGVIEAIAGQHPSRVGHLFCNINLMPAELKRWEASGYRVADAYPFDMFPGTDAVEVLVRLAPVS